MRFAPDIAAAFADGFDAAALIAAARATADRLREDPRITGARRFVFTASGDSLFAATAALPAFRRWSGTFAPAMTSLEFARYEVPLLRPGDVAVGVSNSGSSSRTRETMKLARAKGIPTIGITGSLDGPLAGLVDHVLHRPVKPSERIAAGHRRLMLNIVEYVSALTALYALAAALGGDADARAGRLAALREALAGIPAAAHKVEPAIEPVAASLAGIDTLWALGGGPSWGTALYAAAKFHEQFPLNGIAQDLEEWAHLQYFLTLDWGPRAVAIVHAPAGNALDRAEEVVRGIARAGGRSLVVASPRKGAFPDATWRVDVRPALDELLTPLSFHLPAQLLVLHLAAKAGRTELPLRRRDDYWLIRKGIVRERPDGLA